jgi:uncharacterized protein
MTRIQLIFAVASIVAAGIAHADVSKPAPQEAQTPAQYVESIKEWRKRDSDSLKNENGILALAGLHMLKNGENKIGAGAGVDIPLPPGAGPDYLGTVLLKGKELTLKLAPGVVMQDSSGPFQGERVLKSGKTEWVKLGRLQMRASQRSGSPALLTSDNESDKVKGFPGKIWFEIDPKYVLQAEFVPHKEPKKIPIVNGLDEVQDYNSPGYVQFQLHGTLNRLDAVAFDNSDKLGLMLMDKTTNVETYGAGRYVTIDWPKHVQTKGGPVTVDFNKSYNPACAFSDYYVCLRPPKQNHLSVRVEAGEKYLGKM